MVRIWPGRATRPGDGRQVPRMSCARLRSGSAGAGLVAAPDPAAMADAKAPRHVRQGWSWGVAGFEDHSTERHRGAHIGRLRRFRHHRGDNLSPRRDVDQCPLSVIGKRVEPSGQSTTLTRARRPRRNLRGARLGAIPCPGPMRGSRSSVPRSMRRQVSAARSDSLCRAPETRPSVSDPAITAMIASCSACAAR